MIAVAIMAVADPPLPVNHGTLEHITIIIIAQKLEALGEGGREGGQAINES